MQRNPSRRKRHCILAGHRRIAVWRRGQAKVAGKDSMRIPDRYSRSQVQSVIDSHLGGLQRLPDFVSAEPGFPVVDGAIRREPADGPHVMARLFWLKTKE